MIKCSIEILLIIVISIRHRINIPESTSSRLFPHLTVSTAPLSTYGVCTDCLHTASALVKFSNSTKAYDFDGIFLTETAFLNNSNISSLL